MELCISTVQLVIRNETECCKDEVPCIVFCLGDFSTKRVLDLLLLKAFFSQEKNMQTACCVCAFSLIFSLVYIKCKDLCNTVDREIFGHHLQ